MIIEYFHVSLNQELFSAVRPFQLVFRELIQVLYNQTDFLF